MEARPVSDNISPLDHRYFLANRELFTELSSYLSDSATVRYCVRVEAALLRVHCRRAGIDTTENLAMIDGLENAVTPDEVAAEEEKTRHNVRALVRVIKRHVSQELSPYVHLGATSVDILDTASALRVRSCVQEVILPLAIQVERQLIRLARLHSWTVQVGRTHGQHGVPITFGFALSEYVSRLGRSIGRISDSSAQLVGKLSGAMGAYNSTSLLVDDPEGLEAEVLKQLGLTAAEHSTQMVQPEYLLLLLLEMNAAFGIVANLADDLRNLQRTEIDEVREVFGSEQVGSSTMPQKRNPWNSEHVKSLWKTFSPRVMTFFADQISEHQRDLTNSASSRFVAEYIAGFAAAFNRMREILQGLHVNTGQMEQNLGLTGDLVLAEAAYTLLAGAGLPDAHETVRRFTLESERSRRRLLHLLQDDTEVWRQIEDSLAPRGLDAESFFGDARHYTGRASEVCVTVCDLFDERMNTLGGNE